MAWQQKLEVHTRGNGTFQIYVLGYFLKGDPVQLKIKINKIKCPV